MNRAYILIVFILWGVAAFAQEISEKAYILQDSLLWADYENQYEMMSRCWDEMPDKQDSIQKAFAVLGRNADRRNIELAIQYASVPSGLQRLFMVRQSLSKDRLDSILSTLNRDMKHSFYGKNIQAYIKAKQIEEGDRIDEFRCITEDGKKLRWKQLRGKQLLMLYGGLGCMGETGRQYLKELTERRTRNELVVLIYWPCDSLKDMKEVKSRYPGDYILVSDFKGDASPIKIKYGVQAMPTCFLTDEQHVILVKCTGIHAELFDKHVDAVK